MAVPTGTQRVRYEIQLTEGPGTDPAITVDLRTELTTQGGPSRIDPVLQIGAEAMIAHLETIRDADYPGHLVTAQRIYEGTITGDPWPTT